MSQQSMRECRKAAIHSQKMSKDCTSRAKRLSREMVSYWKRFEKVEKDIRKKAEKEAQEQRKMDLELREVSGVIFHLLMSLNKRSMIAEIFVGNLLQAKRQQRKLNFLITQTELYAHFMARKLTGETESVKNDILGKLDEDKPQNQLEVEGRVLVDVAVDDYGKCDQERSVLVDDFC